MRELKRKVGGERCRRDRTRLAH